MVDSPLFLEKVKEIARNQFKIETARKSRIEKLMKENERLREDTDKLKKKIRDCEEQRRKRMIMIKELRIVHDNAQRGIFADETGSKPALDPTQKIVPQTSVVTPDRPQKPVVLTVTDKKACADSKSLVADPNLVAQAIANNESRNRVQNPCHFARIGNCRYDVRCRSSHNVLPVKYCALYNSVGTCAVPNCPLLHTLYSYTAVTPSNQIGASGVNGMEGGNVGRYAGNRTPPQDITGSRWK